MPRTLQRFMPGPNLAAKISPVCACDDTTYQCQSLSDGKHNVFNTVRLEAKVPSRLTHLVVKKACLVIPAPFQQTQKLMRKSTKEAEGGVTKPLHPSLRKTSRQTFPSPKWMISCGFFLKQGQHVCRVARLKLPKKAQSQTSV